MKHRTYNHGSRAGLVLAAGLLLALPAQAGWLDTLLEHFGDKPDTAQAQSALTDQDLARALKQALEIGAQRVVKQLGSTDAFNANPELHIPLPRVLNKVHKTLSRVGLENVMAPLETEMNRAAEAAIPRARPIVLKAIRQLTWQDVQRIYKGPEDAATRYFRKATEADLRQAMRPVVEKSLSRVGAARTYEQTMQRYRQLPFVKDLQTDLAGYVLDHALDGFFLYLAREEAAIRKDPARRTTDLLKKVFGSGG